MQQRSSGQEQNVLAEVYDGMPVYDSAGAHVGTVSFVKMGDPAAVTTQGQAGPGGGLIEEFSRALGEGEPGVPRQLAERLLRTGYAKVDGAGAFAKDFYLAPDQVADVRDGVVHLAVAREELVRST